jgi:hypothetical protein
MDSMTKFNKKPITINELLKWKNNQKINPRTNRKISKEGDLYKYLSIEYNKHFPQINDETKNKETIQIRKDYKLEDSVDDKDPITLNIFWKIENGIKVVVYENMNDLIFYKDSHNLLRCFEKETLEYLKAHKISKHPVTQDEIPKEIFELVIEKNLEEERKQMSISEKAFEVFQKFSTLSIFIDSEWFLDLDKNKLKKFHYEASSFYKENLSDSQRTNISIDADKLFNLSENEIDKLTLEQCQLYMLNNIDILLEVKKEELKYFINYILIGALGIVIPTIRDLYPDFSFSFSV